MKKLILLACLVLCSFAESEQSKTPPASNLFDESMMKNMEAKEFLLSLEMFDSRLVMHAKNYFETKTCDKQFYNTITVSEIKDFFHSPIYQVMAVLEMTEHESAKKTYRQILDDFAFMNCGSGKPPILALDVFDEFQKRLENSKEEK